LIQVEPVKSVSEESHHRIARVALSPKGGLADVQVQRADPVAPAKTIEPDPTDGSPVHGDDVGIPFGPRADGVLPDVLQGEGALIVHVPPDLRVVLPPEDQGEVLVLERPEDDALACDHGLRPPAPGPPSRAAPRTRRGSLPWWPPTRSAARERSRPHPCGVCRRGASGP